MFQLLLSLLFVNEAIRHISIGEFDNIIHMTCEIIVLAFVNNNLIPILQ